MMTCGDSYFDRHTDNFISEVESLSLSFSLFSPSSSSFPSLLLTHSDSFTISMRDAIVIVETDIILMSKTRENLYIEVVCHGDDTIHKSKKVAQF